MYPWKKIIGCFFCLVTATDHHITVKLDDHNDDDDDDDVWLQVWFLDSWFPFTGKKQTNWKQLYQCYFLYFFSF